MISVTDFPIISSALYPNNFSALRFQLVIVPFRSLLAMASSDDSTIAARRSAASSSFFCRVMSRTIFAAPMIFPLSSRTGENRQGHIDALAILVEAHGFENVQSSHPP